LRLLRSLALLAALIGVAACGGTSSPAPPVVPPALVPGDCAGAHTVAAPDTADIWHVYLDTTRVLGDHFPFPGDTLTLRRLHAGRWLFIAYMTDTGSERGATVTAYAVAPDSSWRRLASGVNEGRCVAFATKGILDGLRPGEHVAFGITFVPRQERRGEKEEAEAPREPPSYFLHVR
jgi:hypothetical protein